VGDVALEQRVVDVSQFYFLWVFFVIVSIIVLPCKSLSHDS